MLLPEFYGGVVTTQGALIFRALGDAFLSQGRDELLRSSERTKRGLLNHARAVVGNFLVNGLFKIDLLAFLEETNILLYKPQL